MERAYDISRLYRAEQIDRNIYHGCSRRKEKYYRRRKENSRIRDYGRMIKIRLDLQQCELLAGRME